MKTTLRDFSGFLQESIRNLHLVSSSRFLRNVCNRFAGVQEKVSFPLVVTSVARTPIRYQGGNRCSLSRLIIRAVVGLMDMSMGQRG
jgi:hypothetical protein